MLVRGTLHPIVANPLEVVVLLSLYLAVLDNQSNEEQYIDVYNTYKRLVYHTAYKIMGDSYWAEDVLQEVFLYVAKNFSKIHRENCHELAAYLVSCSRSRAYDMLRKQRAELDWLLYNKPLEYVQFVLSGEIEHCFSLGCNHGRLKD